MAHGRFNIPYPINEPVLSYAPGSAEREEVLETYRNLYNQQDLDVPLYIGSEQIRTDRKIPMTPPQARLGTFQLRRRKSCSSGHRRGDGSKNVMGRHAVA